MSANIKQIKAMLERTQKQKEQSFTHHEIDESLQDAVTHQLEDDGDVDNFVRRGIDNIALKYAVLGAEWQKEQKPVDVIDSFDDEQFRRGYESGYADAKREQEPVEWSEEDENNIGKLHRLLVICQSEKKFIPTSEYEKLDRWLKSLRPQSKEEQKPVDLEKEIDKTVSECTSGYNFDWDRFARHFYELGLKARKEK